MVRYFYIITIHFQKPGTLGLSSRTQSGEIFIHPGVTRQDIYQQVLEATAKGQGMEVKDTGVVFFSLEPMEMNAVELTDLME